MIPTAADYSSREADPAVRRFAWQSSGTDELEPPAVSLPTLVGAHSWTAGGRFSPSPTSPGANLAAIRRVEADLASLSLDADPEDDERAPTPAALKYATALVRRAAHRAEQAMPRATVASLGDGGLMLAWATGDRLLRLMVDSTARRSYLYLRDEGADHVRSNPTPADLSEWLDWVAQG